MKLDDEDRYPEGLFRHHATLGKLERQLAGHLRMFGNLERLSGFEEVLGCLLSDEMSFDLALDLSRLVVTRAVERVLHDPWRNVTTIPYGVSRAERFAAYYEDDCPFCKAKLDLHDLEPAHEDDCSCCQSLVRDWRKQHAEALRRLDRRTATADA